MEWLVWYFLLQHFFSLISTTLPAPNFQIFFLHTVHCYLQNLQQSVVGIIWCDNCSLSLLTTTTITIVPHAGAFGRVACVNMIKELVGCGNQWFSSQMMTYTRTREHKAHMPTVCHVCQVFVAGGIRCA
jgi:hypothetical protein